MVAAWRERSTIAAEHEAMGGVFVAQAMTWLPALMTVLALVMPLASMLDVHGTEVVAPTVAVLQMSYTLADWLNSGIAGVPQDAMREMWRWGWNTEMGRLV